MFQFDIPCLCNVWTTGFAILLPLLWYWWKRPHSNFPPGPRGVPFLGVIPFCGVHPLRDFKKWSLEKYGSIMAIRMGNKEVVVLNTYDAINEVFRKQGEVSSGRPWVHVYSQILGRYGLAFKHYGKEHQMLKNVLIQSLKRFGMGKHEMEENINDETEHFVKLLQTMLDQPVNLKDYVVLFTINIILKLASGKRYDYHDQTLRRYLHALKLQSDAPNPTAMMLAYMFPNLRFVPPIREANNNYYESEAKLAEASKPAIEEHKLKFDPDNVKDVIDAFLQAKQIAEENGDQFFDQERELEVVIRDMIVGGSETSSYTIIWAILEMLNNFTYYQTIMKEIDSVVDEYGKISTRQRKHMPFTCAYIQEIYRYCAVVPGGVPHCASVDMKIQGFNIPKGTELMSNIWGAHMDPTDWEDPLLFDPNRHLDKDGQFVHSVKIIPFSVGPRNCPGEALARMEVFLIFCNILQNFNIKAATDPLPTVDDGNDFMLYTAKEYKVILSERKVD